MKEEDSLGDDLTEGILSRLANFTVGIVYRDDAGPGHKVLGSGVLADIEGRRGILTCGHVAEQFEKKPGMGLVFISSGAQHKFDLRFDLNSILASSDSFEEAEKVFDLAFTLLEPELSASIEATKGVFLNFEKNKRKMEEFASSRGKFADVVLGLIGEHSDKPEIEGQVVTSHMRGSLYSGRILPVENGLLIFEPRDRPENLPNSFGGMSGSGVWRIYYEECEGGVSLSTHMLCGIASWERRDQKKIACQGWDRIDQALAPAVRKNLTR